MTGNNPETIDGFRICWLSEESIEEIENALINDNYDGLGLNPYRGWNRSFNYIKRISKPPKALVIPFGGAVGFDSSVLETWRDLEFLLVSEFEGYLKIDHDKLIVLRLHWNSKFELKKGEKLRNLYLRDTSNTAIKSSVDSFPNIISLEINSGPIDDITPINQFKHLNDLDLFRLRKVRSLHGLQKLKNLKSLKLENMKNINDISSVLSEMNGLKVLRLIDCGEIPDLSFLSGLSLEEFRCSRTKIGKVDEDLLSSIPMVFLNR